jgi:hypothetical protein
MKLRFETSAHTSAQSKLGETLGRRATGLKKKDEIEAKSLEISQSYKVSRAARGLNLWWLFI